MSPSANAEEFAVPSVHGDLAASNNLLYEKAANGILDRNADILSNKFCQRLYQYIDSKMLSIIPDGGLELAYFTSNPAIFRVKENPSRQNTQRDPARYFLKLQSNTLENSCLVVRDAEQTRLHILLESAWSHEAKVKKLPYETPFNLDSQVVDALATRPHFENDEEMAVVIGLMDEAFTPLHPENPIQEQTTTFNCVELPETSSAITSEIFEPHLPTPDLESTSPKISSTLAPPAVLNDIQNSTERSNNSVLRSHKPDLITPNLANTPTPSANSGNSWRLFKQKVKTFLKPNDQRSVFFDENRSLSSASMSSEKIPAVAKPFPVSVQPARHMPAPRTIVLLSVDTDLVQQEKRDTEELVQIQIASNGKVLSVKSNLLSEAFDRAAPQLQQNYRTLRLSPQDSKCWLRAAWISILTRVKPTKLQAVLYEKGAPALKTLDNADLLLHHQYARYNAIESSIQPYPHTLVEHPQQPHQCTLDQLFDILLSMLPSAQSLEINSLDNILSTPGLNDDGRASRSIYLRDVNDHAFNVHATNTRIENALRDLSYILLHDDYCNAGRSEVLAQMLSFRASSDNVTYHAELSVITDLAQLFDVELVCATSSENQSVLFNSLSADRVASVAGQAALYIDRYVSNNCLRINRPSASTDLNLDRLHYLQVIAAFAQDGIIALQALERSNPTVFIEQEGPSALSAFQSIAVYGVVPSIYTRHSDNLPPEARRHFHMARNNIPMLKNVNANPLQTNMTWAAINTNLCELLIDLERTVANACVRLSPAVPIVMHVNDNHFDLKLARPLAEIGLA